MKLFENIPDGFKRVSDEESYSLTLSTLTHAFGDNHYPIPSIPTDLETSLKTWRDFCKPILDYCIENGTVIANEDCSACLCITEMGKTCEIDLDALFRKSKQYMSEECAQNQKDIIVRMCELESELVYEPGDIFVELFAVTTKMHRKKLGSRLMRTLFNECDKQGRNIFLVTSVEKNYDMYKYFGFEIVKRDYAKDLHALTYLLIRKHN